MTNIPMGVNESIEVINLINYSGIHANKGGLFYSIR